MKLQVIQDGSGKSAGVFIPIEDWTLIKANYPDIETLESQIPDWQKELLDLRINAISKNPEKLRPIEELFDELDREI
ncbi:addiction module protein [Dyadobacter subterraneus]|uniref:Addiction module protein n=1 Tax=Dyadobacter subterraneus TaxID=2773304 RepID=A0ABR9WEX9_9BACT|nr:addiction module protein [Dyadobacter subterraneus]MBE9464048.1 addiction module protein [Dyadobacter subterraneus]